MRINLDAELIEIISNKEFEDLNLDEKQFVLSNINKDEFSFYKKNFSDKEVLEAIVPDESVKQYLDIVLKNKSKGKTSKPLLRNAFKVVASLAILLIVFGTITIFNTKNSEINNEINVSSDIVIVNESEFDNTKEVLLKLGRIENHHSMIVPINEIETGESM